VPHSDNKSSFRSWPILILLLLALGAYANSFKGVFVFDDNSLLESFSGVRVSIDRLSWYAPARPVWASTLALNYLLSGPNPFSYHLFNFVVHLACVLLVFELLRRSLASTASGVQDATRFAFIIAALWAVHPLNTSAVTWITHRDESLASLFILLTLYASLQSLHSARAVFWKSVAVACCLLGMGAKQNAVVTPLLVVAFDYLILRRGKSFKAILREQSAFYLLLFLTWLPFAWLNLTAPRVPNQGFGLGLSPLEYLQTQAGVLLYYIRLAFWPWPLAVDYNGWPITDSFIQAIPAGLVVLAFLAATCVGLSRRNPLSFLGVCFFLVLAPTSTIFPILGDVVAERRMYLPLVCVITLFVLAIDFLLSRAKSPARPPLRAACAILFGLTVVALGLVTVRRNVDYSSEEGFYREAIKQRPGNPRMIYCLATTEFRLKKYDDCARLLDQVLAVAPNFADLWVMRGDVAVRNNQLDEALVDYDKAASLPGPQFMAHFDKGAVLQLLQKNQEAIAEYQAALPGNPQVDQPLGQLGILYARMGLYDQALDALQKSVQAGSIDKQVYLSLGGVLLIKGQDRPALDVLTKAVSLDPSSAEARYNLALVLAKIGLVPESITQLEYAIGLNPALLRPWLSLSWIYSTSPRDSIRNNDRAITLAEHVCELPEGKNDPSSWDAKAAAEANAGKFKEAILDAAKAAHLAELAKNAPLAGAINQRRKLYEQNKPYRESMGPN